MNDIYIYIYDQRLIQYVRSVLKDVSGCNLTVQWYSMTLTKDGK